MGRFKEYVNEVSGSYRLRVLLAALCFVCLVPTAALLVSLGLPRGVVALCFVMGIVPFHYGLFRLKHSGEAMQFAPAVHGKIKWSQVIAEQSIMMPNVTLVFHAERTTQVGTTLWIPMSASGFATRRCETLGSEPFRFWEAHLLRPAVGQLLVTSAKEDPSYESIVADLHAHFALPAQELVPIQGKPDPVATAEALLKGQLDALRKGQLDALKTVTPRQKPESPRARKHSPRIGSFDEFNPNAWREAN